MLYTTGAVWSNTAFTLNASPAVRTAGAKECKPITFSSHFNSLKNWFFKSFENSIKPPSKVEFDVYLVEGRIETQISDSWIENYHRNVSHALEKRTSLSKTSGNSLFPCSWEEESTLKSSGFTDHLRKWSEKEGRCIQKKETKESAARERYGSSDMVAKEND